MATQAADVLIVGAGPTGLTMALELALHNVSFRIIEKSPTASDKSRALVVHPRSLELLNRHGLAEKLVQESTVATGLRVYVRKKQTFLLDFYDLGFDNTAFPRPVFVSQASTESVLASHLESTYGVKVERDAVAEDITQDDSGVDVTITKDGSSERLRFNYVVGCDGAHSSVRHAAALEFEGAPYQQDFVLCDAHLRWDQDEGASKFLSVFLGSAGILVMFPIKHDLVRIVANRPPEMLEGRDPAADPTLENFNELISQRVPGKVELHDPVWLASFRLHHRSADTYRKKRLFVAGDAAHIHSPAGGQGMNTGIQDAINLGWKLARVVHRDKQGKTTGEEWLDSYNDERRRVGMHLLNGTDRIFEYGASTSYWWILWRNFLATWVLPYIIGTRENRARAFRFISQLGIRYRFSPITRASMGTLRVKGGDRAPDNKVKTADGKEKWLSELCEGDKHHLVLFSGTRLDKDQSNKFDAISTRFRDVFSQIDSDNTKVHQIYASGLTYDSGFSDVKDKLHKSFGFQDPGIALIRPDAYIACIDFASQQEELVQWITEYYRK